METEVVDIIHIMGKELFIPALSTPFHNTSWVGSSDKVLMKKASMTFTVAHICLTPLYRHKTPHSAPHHFHLPESSNRPRNRSK